MLDTTLTSIREEVKIILESAEKYFESGKKSMILAPTNMYPTGLEMGEGVKVAKYDESIYILSGHQLVKDALKEGKKLIEVDYVGDVEEINGTPLQQLLNVNLEMLETWQKEAEFKYEFIPEFVKNHL